MNKNEAMRCSLEGNSITGADPESVAFAEGRADNVTRLRIIC